MNIIHGVNTMKLPLPRLMGAVVRHALRRFPVVILTGARQTGKSTLAQSDVVGRGRVYRSMDDYDVLDRALHRPEALIEEAPRMTIDEVQRTPAILLAIKRAVDRDRARGRFLLTGSANLLMMRRVSESLAGRAVYLHLWPMTEAEKSGRLCTPFWDLLLNCASVRELQKKIAKASAIRDWAERILVGGYPVAVLSGDAADRAAWFEGYLRTYLERDLQEIASISALADLRRLMKLAAIRVGQVLNQTQIARDAGLAQPTAHRYLNILETSFQIVRIPAYSVNRTKRLVKSPKLFWTDCGLGAHLAGFSTPESLHASPHGGAFLENLILKELLAWRETAIPRPEIHYWRTQGGEEVDFVIESGRRVIPVEIKAGGRVGYSDSRSLRTFLDEYASVSPFGILLYSGAEVIPLEKRILAVPLSRVFRT